MTGAENRPSVRAQRIDVRIADDESEGALILLGIDRSFSQVYAMPQLDSTGTLFGGSKGVKIMEDNDARGFRGNGGNSHSKGRAGASPGPFESD
jgi:hypothetical protein